jgi:antitoxin MazE
MIAKFTRIGNEWGLVIDPSIIELFQLGPDTVFEVTAEGERIFIKPIGHQISKDQLDAALAEVNRKHGTTLQRLAE